MADEQDFLDDMFYQDLRAEMIQRKKLPNQQPVWTNYGMAGVINFDCIQDDVTNLRICLPDGTDVGFINVSQKLIRPRGKFEQFRKRGKAISK